MKISIFFLFDIRLPLVQSLYMDNFLISRIPELYFGVGNIRQLPEILTDRGYKHIAIITGGSSFISSVYWHELLDALDGSGIKIYHFKSTGETSPDIVDGIVLDIKNKNIDAVIAIGGGTVIDTGKAVSAMLCMPGSIVDYLEGVGTKEPTGIRKPLICIPTTSGTGSEVTKNAVITKIGKDGFKKSLRHKGYISDIVILDPNLVKSCPTAITVSTGLDAITQLLESYVSKKATPFTDALALNGLKLAGRSLPELVKNGENMVARSEMAYASYLSGITLANAGLGVVHGAASVLGAMRSIPHGVVCGTLLGAATETIISKLSTESSSDNLQSLNKYAKACSMLTGSISNNYETSCNKLVKTLNDWIKLFEIPVLSNYGFSKEELLNASLSIGLKNTPCNLNNSEIEAFLLKRI